MTVLSVLSDEEVRAITAEVVANHGDQPVLIVEAKPSFEGDDALYVTVVYPDAAHRPDARRRAEIRHKIGQKLLDRGDSRFVYFSTLSRSEQEELKSLEAEYPSNA